MCEKKHLRLLLLTPPSRKLRTCATRRVQASTVPSDIYILGQWIRDDFAERYRKKIVVKPVTWITRASSFAAANLRSRLQRKIRILVYPFPSTGNCVRASGYQLPCRPEPYFAGRWRLPFTAATAPLSAFSCTTLSSNVGDANVSSRKRPQEPICPDDECPLKKGEN